MQDPVAPVSANPSLKPPKPVPAARVSSRVWLYPGSTAAVGIPAALFLALEGGLRIAGYGKTVNFLIADEKVRLFPDEPGICQLVVSSGQFRPAAAQLQDFGTQGAEHGAWIVVLGESRPPRGSPCLPFAFAAQLRARLLRARYPGKEIDVINTGIVAINSHVVYQIARELSAFSPDLFVVYMGNNEVVGPYGPGCAYLSEMPPLWVIRLSVFVRSTRTGQLMTAFLGKLAKGGGTPAEWGGMSMFVNNSVRGDDPRLEAVYSNFESNLRDIVRVAERAGAKTLLCTVASNA